MNKFWIVLSHTFWSNLKTKSFIISTIVTALIVGGIFNLPNIIKAFDEKEIEQVGIVQNKEVYDALGAYFTQFNNQDLGLQLIETEEEAKAKVDREELAGYIVATRTTNGELQATFKALEVNDYSLITQLEQGLNHLQFQWKAAQLNLTAEQAQDLFFPLTLAKEALSETAKTEEELVQSKVLVYIILFAIYVSVLGYGNLVAMEVIKEKSSRVMEILISSVNPVTQMFGKIIGVSLLGLFQMTLFAVIGFISMQFGDKSVALDGMNIDFANIPSSTLVYGVIFYLLGYFLYATIAAMLGSLVSRMEEMNGILTPLTLVIVAAFMIAMFGLSNPDTPFIVVTSFIPVFTPMIMFLRVGVSDPATWEVLLSLGLLIFTIIGMGWLASKVYRGGVLMYGKSASLKDIRKAISLQKDS